MMRAAIVGIGLILTTTIAFAADPVGRYQISGKNPGGASGYSGTVSVEQTGQTYRVTWTVGRDRYVGTGIGNREFLAVSYHSGNSTGLALYSAKGGNWDGVWAYSDGRQIGTETWSRQ
jgi:hypothetical protein